MKKIFKEKAKSEFEVWQLTPETFLEVANIVKNLKMSVFNETYSSQKKCYIEFIEENGKMFCIGEGDFLLIGKNENIIVLSEEKFNNLYEEINPKTATCIPYQLCPKCNGNGTVMSNETSAYGAYSSGPIVCNLCNGTMVIPMFNSEKEFEN